MKHDPNCYQRLEQSRYVGKPSGVSDTLLSLWDTLIVCVVFVPEAATLCWSEGTFVGIFILPPREALIDKESWCRRDAIDSNRTRHAE